MNDYKNAKMTGPQCRTMSALTAVISPSHSSLPCTGTWVKWP